MVYIEQIWVENVFTLEGSYMHQRVHDNSFTEAGGAVLLSRICGPVNALLSFAYMLLENEITGAVETVGLDLAVG